MKLYIDIGTLVAHLIRYIFAPFFRRTFVEALHFLFTRHMRITNVYG